MALNLNELMKKAKAKGIGQNSLTPSSIQLTRPWQQDSVLYSPNNVTNEQGINKGSDKILIAELENNKISRDGLAENSEIQDDIKKSDKRSTRDQDYLKSTRPSVLDTRESNERSIKISKRHPEINEMSNEGSAGWIIKQEINKESKERSKKKSRKNNEIDANARKHSYQVKDKRSSREQNTGGTENQIINKYVKANLTVNVDEHNNTVNDDSQWRNNIEEQGNSKANKRSSRDHQDINLEAEQRANIYFVINSLVGLQKKMFNYLLEICISNGDICTGFISTRSMANEINCSYDTAKITLKRLINKGILKRLKGKGSRGGFIVLEIPNTIQLIALETKKKRSNVYLGVNQEINPGNKTENNDTCSSEKMKVLSEAIDISALSNIGFTGMHLQQIINQNRLDTKTIQESINAFAFDLQNNNKGKSIKASPLNFFMGILKNGQPYAPPDNYESPEDKAIRVYLEKTKERNRQRESYEKELRELDFKSWDESLSEEQKKEMLPYEIQIQRIQAPKLAFRRQYHQENIWPVKKKEIIAGST